MVRRPISLLVAMLLPFLVFASEAEVGAQVDMCASAFKGTLTGMDLSSVSNAFLGSAGRTFDDTILEVYSASVSPYASFSAASLKGEAKGSIAFSKVGDAQPATSFSLDKAYAKFRFPSFGGRKMTVTFGKAPVSWGVGYYYRIGDVLLPFGATSRCGDGEGRSVWLVEASQGFGSGFSGDVAATIPLEGGTKSVGATVRKSFSNPVMKEVLGFYSYSEEAGHRVALALDLSAYFDMTVGIESRIEGSAVSHRFAGNLMKQYSFETEESSVSVGVYLSGEANLQDKAYETMCSVSVSPSDRADLNLSVVNSFVDGSYMGVVSSLSSSFVVSNGVKASLLCLYGYNNALDGHSFAASLSFEASL